MKRFICAFLLGIVFYSCDKKEEQGPVSQPKELKTDDKFTLTQINKNAPRSTSISGKFNLLGYGYDATEEFSDVNASRKQIIEVEKMENDYPNDVWIGYPHETGMDFYSYSNCIEFSQHLSSKFIVLEDLNAFKGSLKSFFPDNNPYSEKHIYSVYYSDVIHVNYRIIDFPDFLVSYLTEEFEADIIIFTPEELIKKYGTHILRNINLGSKLTIFYQAETENTDREKAANLGLTVALRKAFGLFSGNVDDVNKTSANGNFSQKLSFKAIGGDLSKLPQIQNSESGHPTLEVRNWLQSSTRENAEFIEIEENGLIPLYEVIQDAKKKEEVKSYIQKYLLENQVELIKEN